MAAKSLPSPGEFEDADYLLTSNAEDISAQQADVDEQVNAIMSEVGSDKNDVTLHFQVMRVVKDKAEMRYLFKGFISDLPIMDRLRDEYADEKEGGKFLIQIYKNKKRYKRITVNVEAPRKPKEVLQPKNDTAEILRAIADQQASMHKQLVETLMQVAGKPATAQPSQMEMMLGMVALMKGMKEVVNVPAASAPSMDPAQYMDMFIRGMEMGKESGGGAGSSMTDVLRDAVKALPMLANMGPNKLGPSSPRPAFQPPTPSTPQFAPVNAPTNERHSPPTPTADDEVPDVNIHDAVVKQQIGLLVKKAEQDSDPALYADFIIDNVSEDIIKQYLLQDDLVNELGKIDPKVLQHREWFMELRDNIFQVLTAPEEDTDTTPHDPIESTDQLDADSDGAGGDTSNP